MRWRLASSSASTCVICVSDRRLQALFRELLVGFGVNLRAVELGLDVGGLRLLLEQLVLQPHPEAGEVGFGAAQLQLGVEQLLLHALVAQLQNIGVGFDDGAARQRDDPLDRGFGGRGDPADVFGHQRAGATHLAEHRAPLDGVAPIVARLHGRRRRLQLRQTDRDQHADEQAGDAENDAA